MKNYRTSNKSEKQLKEEEADRLMSETPYEEIRLDDSMLVEKMKAKQKHKGRWERIRQKLDGKM